MTASELLAEIKAREELKTMGYVDCDRCGGKGYIVHRCTNMSEPMDGCTRCGGTGLLKNEKISQSKNQET